MISETPSAISVKEENGGVYFTCLQNATNINLDYYKNETTLPRWMTPGKSYYLKLNTNLNAGTISLIVYVWDASNNFITLARYFGNTTDNYVEFTIPSNAVGAWVRVNIHNNDGALNNQKYYYYPMIFDKIPTDLNNLVPFTLQDTLHYVKFTTDDTIYTSCDDIDDQNSIIFISSKNGVLNIPDFPIDGPGWLITMWHSNVNNNLRMQYAVPYYPSLHKIKYRIMQFNTWTDWYSLGSGSGGTTTTITQEVSRDSYQNTYNITTNPTITTDSNGWLKAVDTNTESEADKTDMTGAIMSMLISTGYCHLGPGIFYVSGNIDVPSGATLEGCGNKTIIRLLSSVSSGYIIRLKEYATVKNIRFSGAYSPSTSVYDVSNTNIGGRIGISFVGNRSGNNNNGVTGTCRVCQISDCWFEGLDSGFFGNDAGGGLQEGVEVVNCYFYRCKAGINLDYWTEYCKFTNCVTFQCYYACINNGGNNVFTACTFHGVIGFLADNSGSNKNNNGHGSIIGCTFNHINNMNENMGNGIAIKLINIDSGLIFVGCQLWYGNVYVENSNGTTFTSCMFGNSAVTIDVIGNPIFLHGNTFHNKPTINSDVACKLDNNYTNDGTLVSA